MANKNNHLVVAYYTNAAAAETAADELKDWDKASKDIKLGAFGILTLNPNNGELEVKEVGQRDTGKGALWGTAVGATLGVLSAGILLIPGIVAGAAGGAAAGALNHKSLGMTDADRENMAEQLRHGGAALGIMCDDFEVEATKAEMLRLGGKVEMYDVPDVTAEMLAMAAEEQKNAAAVVDEKAIDLEPDLAETASRAVSAELPDVAGAEAAAISSLVAVSGLSATDAKKVYDDGFTQASALMGQASTPKGRAALAKETGLDEAIILSSAKKMDLMRIDGVGVKYANLLLASGVDTVVELAGRNAANLATKMSEVNDYEHLLPTVPSESVVAGWVAQAKDLPRMIYY
ncbi:MAG: DUF4332 domain-containing protein [Chloroflexota bacterium]